MIGLLRHRRPPFRRLVVAAAVSLIAAVVMVAPATGADTLGLVLDGSGTLRVDGGSPVPEGGAVAAMFAGSGPAPIPRADRDRIAGIGVLVRPFSPVEVGIAFPRLARRSDIVDGPIVDPGPLLFQLRTAVIPELKGVAITLAGTAPINRIDGVTEPTGVEPRLAYSTGVGPFRPMANIGVTWWADGRQLTWAAAGLKAELPLGVELRGDLQVPLEDDLRWGAELAIPIGPGSSLIVDGWRGIDSSGAPPFEVVAGLVLRSGAGGPGPAFRNDRDGDGLLNAEDACPRVWGDGPDGCPSPVQGLQGCGCPLLDLSLFELERLLVSLSVVPDGAVYVIEVRAPYQGDPWTDWDNTSSAVEGTRGALLDLGVPPGNFTVIGRKPVSVTGVPLLSIRQMPLWKAPAYIESAEIRKPDM